MVAIVVPVSYIYVSAYLALSSSDIYFPNTFARGLVSAFMMARNWESLFILLKEGISRVQVSTRTFLMAVSLVRGMSVWGRLESQRV